MKEEILKRIDILAERLEVTGRQLFGIVTEGILYSNIVYMVIYGVVLVALLSVFRKSAKNVIGLSKLSKEEWQTEDGKIALGIIGFATLCATLLIVSTLLISSIAKCIAPEYAAVHEILEVLR